MSIARGLPFRLASALIALSWAAFMADGFRMAQAQGASIAPQAPSGSGWSAGGAASALVIVLLIAALAFFAQTLWTRWGGGRPEARLMMEAGRLTGRGYAMVSVLAHGPERLPAQRRKGAMRSLRLYLEGALGPDERCARTARNEFTLLLACGDSAAFHKRLAILEQDAAFLYMASHPGQGFGARVCACRIDEAGSAPDALRRARAGHGAAAQ